MKPEKRAELRALATRSAVAAGAVLAVVGVALMLLNAAETLVLIFAGLLFAVLLSAAADTTARATGMSRRVALAALLIVGTAALVGGMMALWPSVSREMEQLAQQLPSAASDIRQTLQERAWGRALLDALSAQRASGLLSSGLGAIGSFVIVLFVGLYVAAQPGPYHRGARWLAPRDARDRFDEVLFEVIGVLRRWLLGKLASMTIVGMMTYAGLWWLDVPLALTFALLAFALAFIPNFGPILSVIPPALIVFADDPRRSVEVIVLYIVIQTIESYAITPLIQRKAVAMPPALTITAQVVLGVLVGGIGVAVATPLTAAVLTVASTLFPDRSGKDG